MREYVASRSLTAPLAEEEDGQELRAIGRSQLVQTLLEHGLVDELRIMLDPSPWAEASASSADTATRRQETLREAPAQP